MTEHFYQDIEGWFDFPHVYREALARVKPGGSMTEVGVCYGKSFFFLAVEAARIELDVALHAVDPFRWPHDCWQVFQTRAKSIEKIVDIRIHRGLSTIVARSQFSDQSQDFIFIDAEHTHEQVRNDMHAWWPKVKKGGVLAGHDWGREYPGVEKAVVEFIQHERLSHADLRVILCEEQAEKPAHDARYCWWIEKR
jgi:cephalosporin hydroxylase